MKRVLVGRVLGVLLILLLTAWASWPMAQPFAAQIQVALAQLTSGQIPFTTVGVNTNGYINFGTGRGVTGYGFRDSGAALQYKTSAAGAWTTLPATAAPSDATYITQTAHAGLTNEQALSGVGTALVQNATGTGVLSAYTGTSCTNQFPRSLSALGVATCAAVSLVTDIAGVLGTSAGGTGGNTTATANRYLKGNGTTWATSTGSASGTGACGANTFATTLNSDAAPTCTQPASTNLSDQTEWTAVTFAAGNFTANGAMTWTLAAGDQTDFKYRILGKMMWVKFDLTATTVGGTPDTTLQITIPDSRVAASNAYTIYWLSDNSGTGEAGRLSVLATGTIINVQQIDNANWAAATDTTVVRGEIFFEIQ